MRLKQSEAVPGAEAVSSAEDSTGEENLGSRAPRGRANAGVRTDAFGFDHRLTGELVRREAVHLHSYGRGLWELVRNEGVVIRVVESHWLALTMVL